MESGSDIRTTTARLLWAGSSPWPDATKVAALVDEGADVRLAGTVALHRRVGPLLLQALEAADRTEALADAAAMLRSEADLRRAQAAVLLPLALAIALEPLTAAGLEPVIFKGPALAMRYPAPALRAMDDIDVLVHPGQRDHGVALLKEAGWTVHEREGHHYDTVLGHPSVPGLALELHAGLDSWRDQSHHLKSMDLWRGRIPLDCMGTRAYGLAPEDELIALAAHAGKPFHQFQRLIWSVDFAVVVHAADPALDWDQVAQRAERWGCTTVVAVALRHARRLGADVPDEMLALPASRYRRAALAPVLDEAWPLLTPDQGETHRLRYALWDARSRHVQLFIGEITRQGLVHAPRDLLQRLWIGVRRWRRWRRAESPVEDDLLVRRG